MDATADPTSLKDLCIRKAANCISHIFRLDGLNIPHPLQTEIAQYIQSDAYLKDYEYRCPLVDFRSSVDFPRFGVTYSRATVSNLFNFSRSGEYDVCKLHLIRRRYILHGDEEACDVNLCANCFRILDMALECINFDVEYTHDIFWFFEDLFNYMQDVKNWCEYCHQSPLFEFATAADCNRKFGFMIHKCECINDAPFSARRALCFDCIDGEKMEWNLIRPV